MYQNQIDANSANSLGNAGNRPQSTLESAVGSAHAVAAKLAQAIEMLDMRLQAVMTPAVPVPTIQDQTKGLAMVETPHSPVVNELHALCGRLQALTAHLSEMSGRIEA